MRAWQLELAYHPFGPSTADMAVYRVFSAKDSADVVRFVRTSHNRFEVDWYTICIRDIVNQLGLPAENFLSRIAGEFVACIGGLLIGFQHLL